MRDFCKKLAKHEFFTNSSGIANVRLAHFDVAAKVMALEIEGINTGLRYEDIKTVFDNNSSFSPTSAAAKRVTKALDLLKRTFPSKSNKLKTRTVVQSIITLTCALNRDRRVPWTDGH